MECADAAKFAVDVAGKLTPQAGGTSSDASQVESAILAKLPLVCGRLLAAFEQLYGGPYGMRGVSPLRSVTVTAHLDLLVALRQRCGQKLASAHGYATGC